MKKLRVWWIPQVPMKAFYVEVSSLQEGVRLLTVLADYDAFQFKNNIKPDYCNVGGIEEFINGEWLSWEDEKTGEDNPVKFVEEVANI